MTSIVKSLTESLEKKSNDDCVIYLNPDMSVLSKSTFYEIELKAKAIAALLQQHKIQKGDRVLLIYEPGKEFYYAFLGCLYAGAIAVPCYPPVNKRLIDKLSAIINNSKPKCILSSTSVVTKIKQLRTIKILRKVPFVKRLLNNFKPGITALTEWDFHKFKWITTDSIDESLASTYQHKPISGDDIAFLQYTSGSTSLPKGVIVKHENLIQNIKTITANLHIDENDSIVSWLPPYHDMGLIGSMLTGLENKLPVYLMSPIDFIKNPLIWLNAISKYRGTLSPAPNFAYALCVKRINENDLAQLNLSSWRAALNGSEPINPHILDEFHTRFSRFGFRKEAIYPCYGLAEATLFVSGRFGLHTQDLPSENNLVNTKPVISCGKLNEDVIVKIVNTETGTLVSQNQIGEVCIHGESVTHGYWDNEEINESIFVNLEHNKMQKKFLRTGDLGYIVNNELFITGRIKELIIIRGVNYYPQDIEYTVYKLSDQIGYGSCVAFSIESSGEEHLGLVFEGRNLSKEEARDLFSVIKKEIMDEHQLIVHSIAAVQPKSILKTTSGKLQRVANKNAFINDEFDVIEKMVLSK